MNKLIAFFVFVFICGSLIGFTSEGQIALATTVLSADVDDESTVIPVSDTTDFLSAHFVIIGSELIQYTAKTDTCPAPYAAQPECFTGAIRGAGNTSAQGHNSGLRVYNQVTGVVNQIVGFNLTEQMSTSGTFSLALQLPVAFANAFIKALVWDFSFLQGPYAFFKYIVLYPISGGFIWSIYIMFSNIFVSLFRR